MIYTCARRFVQARSGDSRHPPADTTRSSSSFCRPPKSRPASLCAVEVRRGCVNASIREGFGRGHARCTGCNCASRGNNGAHNTAHGTHVIPASLMNVTCSSQKQRAKAHATAKLGGHGATLCRGVLNVTA